LIFIFCESSAHRAGKQTEKKVNRVIIEIQYFNFCICLLLAFEVQNAKTNQPPFLQVADFVKIT